MMFQFKNLPIKFILPIFLVIAISIGAYTFYFNKQSLMQGSELTTTTTIQKTTTTTTLQSTSANNYVVRITADGFSPSTLTIKVGDTVTWINEDSKQHWIASDPHPIHTGYPEKGGCIGSTFDSCRGLNPGESWSFTFRYSGTWGYHDHLRPYLTGKIIVE